MKKNRINFLRRTQLLQSATLICVILMIISLVRVSALLPGVSKEADKKKSQAKAKIYEKEYVRGSILDRNGNTIAFSQKPGGARTYSHPYAFSNLVGYWSKIYGTYGGEQTMNEELVHSNCGANPKQKKGADVSKGKTPSNLHKSLTKRQNTPKMFAKALAKQNVFGRMR